jgi:hypothetical protein
VEVDNMKLYLTGVAFVVLGVILAFVFTVMRISGALPISATIASIGTFLIMSWFVRQVTTSIKENKQ